MKTTTNVHEEMTGAACNSATDQDVQVRNYGYSTNRRHNRSRDSSRDSSWDSSWDSSRYISRNSSRRMSRDHSNQSYSSSSRRNRSRCRYSSRSSCDLVLPRISVKCPFCDSVHSVIVSRGRSRGRSRSTTSDLSDVVIYYGKVFTVVTGINFVGNMSMLFLLRKSLSERSEPSRSSWSSWSSGSSWLYKNAICCVYVVCQLYYHCH